MDELKSNEEAIEPLEVQGKQWQANRVILYAGLAAALFLATFFYSFIIPQTPGRLTRPSVALIPELPLWSFVAALPLPIPQSSWTVSGALVVFTAIAFAAYGLAVLVSWNRQTGRRTLIFVVLTAVVFSLISAFSLPNTSTDIFNYMVNGRIAAVYGSNPYYVVADEFPDDPVYPYASKAYTDQAADKMPFWMLANISLARLTGNNVTANLLIYRSALMLINVANLLLIGIIAYRLNPLFLMSALIIYGWNPVVIVHAQSKSDTLMALLILLAILLLVSKRRVFAVAALVLSVMVKLITLPLLGVYMLGNLRLRRWRALFNDVLIFFIVPLLAYLLFWQSSELNARFMALFTVAGAAAPGVLQLILIAGFCLLILAISFVQDGSISKLLWGWALVMLYFSFFLTKLGLAWYLITLLAIVSLVFDWRIVLLTGALSITSFLFNAWYTTFSRAFPAPDIFSVPPFLVYVLVPLLIAGGAVLAALGWQQLKKGEGHRRS